MTREARHGSWKSLALQAFCVTAGHAFNLLSNLLMTHHAFFVT
jgi:hypothetical protein